MRVLSQLLSELHMWGAAALMVFPAHRRLRRVEADRARLRRAAILSSVEPLAAENRRLRASVAQAADVLVAALEEPATRDVPAPEGLRLVRSHG